MRFEQRYVGAVGQKSRGGVPGPAAGVWWVHCRPQGSCEKWVMGMAVRSELRSKDLSEKKGGGRLIM